MTAKPLLELLDGVKRTGQSRYLARCPAHKDRQASLSIRERDDGALLIHCFAGCSPHEIVEAVGLTLADLFPTRQHHVKGDSRPIPIADILRALAHESTVILIAGRDILNGNHTEGNQLRVLLAVERIKAGLTAGGWRHE